MKGFIIYSTYDIVDEKTQIQLFGKLENGQSFVAINNFEPYFYIKEEDLKKIDKYLEKFKVEKTDFANFNGDKVAKIIAPNHRELNKLFQGIHSKVDTYEADIKPHTRFLIDKNILSSLDIEGEHTSAEKIDCVYKEPDISPVSEIKHKLKVTSLDIETTSKADKIICIGMHGEDYNKVFMVTDRELEHTISCKTEEEMLIKFKSEFLKLDPDVIIGWNVIDFDLKYIESAFSKYKIPFDIGRNNDRARLRIEASYMRSSSADIPGRQVLDGLQLIQDPFLQQAPTMRFSQFESYTLEDVSQVILGKGKLLKGNLRCNELDRLYKENTKASHQKISDYNLNDCRLVYEILEKTDTISLAVERSELTGMTLDRITSSIAAFDSLYIREAKKHRIVSPTTRYGEKEERLKGGYVFSSGA
ncbi:MAG: ribonuclease H-like domain-containing protein, partial [archaeon]|nr:ribonuclease H-like domain-containing protein [archaeon]